MNGAGASPGRADIPGQGAAARTITLAPLLAPRSVALVGASAVQKQKWRQRRVARRDIAVNETEIGSLCHGPILHAVRDKHARSRDAGLIRVPDGFPGYFGCGTIRI